MSPHNESGNVSTHRKYLPLDDGEIFARAEESMERRRLFLDPVMSMETLAVEIGIHRNSLSRAVNLYSGMSFPLWVAGYRVIEAERLAREEKMPLDRIAKMAGFSNRSTFCRVYSRIRGKPPSAVIRGSSKDNSNNNIKITTR